MPEKDPLAYSAVTYGWVLILSVWGGLINYCQKYRAGIVSRYKITELIGDISASGFSGVLTFYLCEWAQLNQVLSAFFIGLSGHMGARSLFLFESIIEKWIKRKYEP